MIRHRELGFLFSASLHSVLLIGIAGLAVSSPRPSTLAPVQNEPVHVEIVDLSDLRGHVFDFDIAKLSSRIDRLFPFTEQIVLSAPAAEADKNSGVGILTMESHLAMPIDALILSDSEMEAVLDASWSRRQRWDAFQHILDLVRRFDPNHGDLPALLRRYSHSNLLQPFHASQNPEPRVWGLLSVAADHSAFVQFITSFVTRAPSSKATTELLFLLDKLVQANFNAALSLLDLDPVGGMTWTRRVSPKGAEVLLALRAYHERGFRQRGLWDEAALARRYDDVRVSVLKHLIRTTPMGYRVNDAQFLIGEIFWQQRRQSEALEAWGGIKPDPNDEYFVAYSDVRASIANGISARPQIDAALNEQSRRWTDTSFQRLRHFGFTFDTF